MKRFFKKAFTLVELLVVIAIIAVLAVVGIVSYSAFTKKAELSNDVGLITQINTVLQADEAAEGKNHTFHDVRADVLENGIDLAKIKLSSKDFRLAWDSNQDRVVLLDDKTVAVAPDDYVGKDEDNSQFMFVVAKDAEEVKTGTTFNFYLPDDFDVTGLAEQTVHVGIDVGNHVNVDIKYEASDSVTRVFNTNGGILTVNNGHSTIEHYGSAQKAVITAVDPNNSYHCHAIIAGSIDVAQGHVVVESSAEVPLINVVAPEEGTSSGVSIEYKSEKKDIPVLVADGVSSENVTIPETAEKVDLSTIGKDVVAISTYKANDDSNKIHTYTAEEFAAVSDQTKNPLWGGNCIPGGTTEITLLQNVELKQYVVIAPENISKNYNVALNLNGKTLTLSEDETGNSGSIGSYSKNTNYHIDLMIKNGNIQDNTSKYNGIEVAYGSSVTLEDVTYEGGTSAIFVQGSGTKAIVKNSQIKSEKIGYCISTNAAVSDHWEVEIMVENSTLTSAGTAIMLNVPGTLDIKNSTIEAPTQTILLRSGNANIVDSELKNTCEGDEYVGMFNTTEWKTGNYAEVAAITVGNKSILDGYQNSVSLKMTRCKLDVVNKKYPALYAWSNNANGKGVTIDYVDCTFDGKMVLGGDTPLTTSNSYYTYTEYDIDLSTDIPTYYYYDEDKSSAVKVPGATREEIEANVVAMRGDGKYVLPATFTAYYYYDEEQQTVAKVTGYKIGFQLLHDNVTLIRSGTYYVDLNNDGKYDSNTEKFVTSNDMACKTLLDRIKGGLPIYTDTAFTKEYDVDSITTLFSVPKYIKAGTYYRNVKGNVVEFKVNDTEEGHEAVRELTTAVKAGEKIYTRTGTKTITEINGSSTLFYSEGQRGPKEYYEDNHGVNHLTVNGEPCREPKTIENP